MNADQQIWGNWAKSLTRMGIANKVLDLLEFVEPLSTFGAQFLYAFQPLINFLFPANDTTSLAHLLEDPHQLNLFKELLRSERNQ